MMQKPTKIYLCSECGKPIEGDHVYISRPKEGLSCIFITNAFQEDREGRKNVR